MRCTTICRNSKTTSGDKSSAPVRGKMMYYLVALPLEQDLAQYESVGRGANIQWLDLPPAQAQALADELGDAALPLAMDVTSVLLGLELSQNAFTGRPSYKRIAHLPFAERLALLRQPELRAQILAEEFEGDRRGQLIDRWDRMYPLGDPPDYEPGPEDSIAGRAARDGRARPA